MYLILGILAIIVSFVGLNNNEEIINFLSILLLFVGIASLIHGLYPVIILVN